MLLWLLFLPFCEALWEPGDRIVKKIRVDSDLTITVVDNYFANIDAIMKIPLELSDRHLVNYPGLKYDLSIPPNFEPYDCHINEILTEPSQLGIFQAEPHCDGAGSRVILVYFEDIEDSGTAFYRNKQTNRSYPRFSPSGMPSVLSHESQHALYNYEFQSKTYERAYMWGPNKNWDLLYHVQAKKNRALIYSGEFYHSAVFKTFHRGRLTLNCMHWIY